MIYPIMNFVCQIDNYLISYLSAVISGSCGLDWRKTSCTSYNNLFLIIPFQVIFEFLCLFYSCYSSLGLIHMSGEAPVFVIAIA
jgi:hypothetical protein